MASTCTATRWRAQRTSTSAPRTSCRRRPRTRDGGCGGGGRTKVRSQKSEVRSQKSEVRSQKSKKQTQVQSTKYKVRSTKYEVRSTKYDGPGWSRRCVQSAGGLFFDFECLLCQHLRPMADA